MGDQRSVAVSTAIFLAGMGVSGAIYFSGRAVTFNDAVISNFLSPSDNPNGYLPAALATALAGLMLAPTVVTLCRRMGRIHRWGSMLGTAFYATGLLAAIPNGCLAPVHGLDFPIHLVLAYMAFISLQTGISVYLTVAAYGAKMPGRIAFAAMEWSLAVTLLALSFGPDWPGSTTVCEWGLCGTIAMGLCVLTSWCS